jgi:DNA-binding transcriptional ArsR family regulator
MPSNPQSATLTLDRRLIEHPHALHLKRMRIAIWLYLDLLSRLAKDADTLEIAPADIALDMGLAEGTIRSWLGHLRKAGYVDVMRRNGTLKVLVKRMPERVSAPPPVRFFTLARLKAALGDSGNDESLEAALNLYPDPVIKRALAGALAVPGEQIRKSRTSLFLYLTKRYAQEI